MARTGFHIVLGILLWVVFGYYWTIVFQRPITPHTRFALFAVAVIVAAISLFLVYWVVHNRRIARTTRRRRRRTADTTDAHRDFVGRLIVTADDAKLKNASYIEVHVVEMAEERGESVAHKVFRTGDALPR